MASASGRNVACIVEAHHDDKGIVWPEEVAPYAAHLVAIGASSDAKVAEVAERLHELSIDAGREILYDDRDESPGVKFTDAELLGMPWILTVSPRSLAAGGVEVTERATGERSTRSIDEVEALIRGEGLVRPDPIRPAATMGPRCRPARCCPRDDLYARLELPVDCSPEAIEIAWRALLKRHHPDVAGAHADDVAKRINVAHDWLSDPELRERYDRERHPGLDARSVRPRCAPSGGAARRAAKPARLGRLGRLGRPTPWRRSIATSPRIGRLKPGRAGSAGASPSRRRSPSLPRSPASCRPTGWPPSRQSSGASRRRCRRSSRWDAPTRDAIVGYAHELLLGPFLDEHLSEPFRERVRERLARGWESAVDQPRYGPNTVAVSAALERLRTMPPGRRGQLVVEAAGGAGSVAGIPRRTPVAAPASRPQDDDALRVSSALAQRDAEAIVGDPAPAIARRSLGRAMHGLVLRHAFKPAELDRLLGPWREVLVEPASPRPRARTCR